jgi:hypothetical protein
MAGIPLGSADSSEKFLHDVRETIAGLLEDNFYQPMARLAHAKGCTFSAESVAPTMTSDGMLHYQTADIPMGEFWLRSPTHDKPNDMLDAISGAHIYGKQIVQAEAFTELRMAWDEHPGMLKTLQDRNYALGINRLVFHVFTHNPWMGRRPGMTLDGIGTFLQRDQTWWKPGKAWVDYTQRCQWLLQQGRPVADIAVFTGEELPRRAILPDRLVNDLPGLFGAERVASEALRLNNAGEPVTSKPNGVVSRSANMVDPADWVDALHGYAYDCLNPDAVLRLGEVRAGRIVLPGGASYKVLVLPASVDTSTLSSLLKQRLWQWKKQGAIILNAPYTASSLNEFGLAADFRATEAKLPASHIAYTHRTAPGLDIYFVSNQLDRPRCLDISVRVKDRLPELWDAVTGGITPAFEWHRDSSRTVIRVCVPENGSIFIVLRRGAGNNPGGSLPKWIRPGAAQPLNSPWTVRFDPALGGPAAPVVFNELSDWSKNTDSAIRYYSGTAVYSKSFNWNGPGRAWLEIGRVANMASVRVNGIDCGVAWTPPYRIEVTKALRAGLNKLEIAVTNTWANRLIGDHRLPEDRRITWTTAPYRLDGSLLEAGIMGEVRLSVEAISEIAK